MKIVVRMNGTTADVEALQRALAQYTGLSCNVKIDEQKNIYDRNQ